MSAVNGWEELRRLAEAASPGPYVFNGYPFTLGGADAEFAIASANYVRSRLAAARGEPPEPGPAINVERLSAAMSTAYKSVGSWDDFDDTVLAFAEATVREYAALRDKQ